MDYPYRKYLKYLVTRQMDHAQIMENCLRINLVVPTAEDISVIRAEVGRIPSSWEPRFNKQNEYFCKWLRKQDVIKYWRQDPDFLEATNFLYRLNVRKDFETLSISHSSITDVRQILLMKYEPRLVPSVKTLEVYCKHYWDLTQCTREGLVEYLSMYHNREANLAAVVGNVSQANAQASLPEVISDEMFYDNFISMVHRQVSLARRDFYDDIMPGTMMMGMAALARQANDAMAARKEIKESGRIEVLDTIRQQALSFQMRTIEGSDIITIEDLSSEESEEESADIPALTIVSK